MRKIRFQAAFLILIAIFLFPIAQANASNTFPDISDNHWAKEPIERFSQAGAINGFTDGTFRPNHEVTRAQAAKILASVLNLPTDITSVDYSDVDENFYAYGAIQAMHKEGIMIGNEGKFRPYDTLTRGEMAVMLTRVFEFKGNAPSEFQDVPRSYYAFDEIHAIFANGVTVGFENSRLFKPKKSTSRGEFVVFLANAMDASKETPEVVEKDPNDSVKDAPELEEEVTLYDTIYQALVDLESEINVSEFTTDADVGWGTLKQVLADHPEIFYFQYEGSLFWSNGLIELKYKFPETEIVDMRNQLEAKADQIIASEIEDDMSDVEKVKAIHDYVVLNTAYDYDNFLQNTVPDASYHIHGLLLDGYAVCDGYAKTMKYLLEKIGIETLYVTGTGNGGLHSWNKVNIDGNWYNVDATWDDPVPNRDGYVRYDYFLISDDQLAEDHTWDNTGLPKATESFSN